MNWKTFLQTLTATVIAGGAEGATQVLGNSNGKVSWSNVGVGAAIGAILYLAKSPRQTPAPATVPPAVEESAK